MNNTVKVVILVGIATSLPIFRSGGVGGMTFWQWVWNHTIFGPPVEYVPEEDYKAALSRNITRRG